jgi:vesicle-associated membrane protein 7
MLTHLPPHPPKQLLVDKTDRLNQQAFKFEKQSKRLKNVMWWKKVKMWLAIAFIVAVIIFAITAMACGGLTFHNCKSNN